MSKPNSRPKNLKYLVLSKFEKKKKKVYLVHRINSSPVVNHTVLEEEWKEPCLS